MSHSTALAIALTVLAVAGVGCAPKAPVSSAIQPAATAATVLFEQRDATGRLLYAEIDEDGDAEADRAYTHRYDSVGNLIATGLDRNMDGVFDATRFASWDGHGDLIEEIYDVDGDGIIDHRIGPGRDGVAEAR